MSKSLACVQQLSQYPLTAEAIKEFSEVRKSYLYKSNSRISMPGNFSNLVCIAGKFKLALDT